MKKFILLALAATSLSACSIITAPFDWASSAFDSEPTPNPNQPNSNYPYYYSSAMPIDAPAAAQQPMPTQPAFGGYAAPNAPATSITMGNGGVDVRMVPPAQPTMQAPAQQYQQYQPAPQYAPVQPQMQPMAQPQPQVQQQYQYPQLGQPNPQDPYQQLYYGQQYAPQTYTGQYQYPPMPK